MTMHSKSRDRKWKSAEFGMKVWPNNLGDWPDDVWDIFIMQLEKQHKKEAEERLRLRKQLKVYTDGGVDVSPLLTADITDAEKGIMLRADLKQLRYRYMFQHDQYTFMYGSICKKFEQMETYIEMLANTNPVPK
jgi:hypothetical protein